MILPFTALLHPSAVSGLEPCVHREPHRISIFPQFGPQKAFSYLIRPTWFRRLFRILKKRVRELRTHKSRYIFFKGALRLVPQLCRRRGDRRGKNSPIFAPGPRSGSPLALPNIGSCIKRTGEAGERKKRGLGYAMQTQKKRRLIVPGRKKRK